MEMKSIELMLGQLRTAAALAAGTGVRPAAEAASKSTDFAAVLKASLDQASAMQDRAGKLARDFELGAPGASLPDVMLSIQKASLSFQQVVQVRNKLVSAYHDIMNMQV